MGKKRQPRSRRSLWSLPEQRAPRQQTSDEMLAALTESFTNVPASKDLVKTQIAGQMKAAEQVLAEAGIHPLRPATPPKTAEQKFALKLFQNCVALLGILESDPTDGWLVARLSLSMADSYHRFRTEYEGISHFAALGMLNESGRKGAIASKSESTRTVEAQIERLALKAIRNEERYLGGQMLAEKVISLARREGSKGLIGAGGAILKLGTVKKTVEKLRRDGKIPGR